ncbi:PREDICTED: uncharacterized protein LOC109351869 isoform X2 [Lupinus angustifolius]|uniref:uncharacterized protein LOC109351869 isoform X2 n=1 Tax=Lupinus angustifolius TaxID=3871 RepID=UPI00092EA4D1|nr:PREDICTED: uncharacterized protein LOC109351869 isoform X2 [Lupinus angustifolius]
MILQNLMEEKQLDFYQPLLSVRRFPSTAASENDNKRKGDMSSAELPPLPVYKSELKSGPMRNPGAVPFVWEQTPGRPKDENKVQTQWPSVTPKLPPGRVSKVKQQHCDEVSKARSVRQSRTGSTVSSPQIVATLDKEVTKQESLEEAIQEKASSGSDDEDENYVDAVDTLSRTESILMNCSVSGLSGLDDQEAQPCGTFSTDKQARDFMIGRFLPAAKAMASETPRYTSRKALVIQEQSNQVNKLGCGENSRPLNPKWQKVLPQYAQDIVREESEDESDDDVSENYAPKVCGLFPRFCLLNPILGLRMEDGVLNSAGHRMQGKSIASYRRTAKEHAKIAYHGKKSVDSPSGFTQEKDFLNIPEKSKHGIDPHRRGFSKVLDRESTQCESSCDSPVAEKTLYVDSVHVKYPTSYSSETKGSTNHGGDDLETLRKDDGIDKNPSVDCLLEDSKNLGIVDEKATLQTKSSVSLDSSLACSDNSKRQGFTNPGYQGSNLDHNLVATSSPKMVEIGKIESESEVPSSKKRSSGLIQKPVSWNNSKLASDLEVGLKSQQATKDQECRQDSRQDPNTLASSKVVGDGKIGLERKSPMKLGHRQTSDASSLKLPLALPLPKAPSESWLTRTLPTVSSRSIPSWSNLTSNNHALTQSPKTALVDPKWEIIVKSSNVLHGRLRFSEEPLAPIPEA